MRRLTRFWIAPSLHRSTPHRRSREELAVIADRFITDTASVAATESGRPENPAVPPRLAA